MPLSTYAELQAEMGNFLNRSDLTAQYPTFIALAESQMNRDVKHWKGEKRSQTAITERYVSIPDDFRRPIRLYIDGANGPLDPITSSEMQEMRRENADQTGTPCYYALSGGDIELFPTPTEGSLNMLYRADIPPLSDTNTSNWLLAEAPDVYLYGALLQSAPYLEHDERLTVWSGLYLAGYTNLNRASDQGKWGGQKLRMR